MKINAKATARFWSHVVKSDDCWLWNGKRGGYGQFMVNYKNLLAHRVSLFLAGVPMPRGLVSDHLCRVRSCVNPKHLRMVSNRENLLVGDGLAARNAKKTHCRNGHEYTEENTIRVRSTGERRCRKCTNGTVRKWYRKKRALNALQERD